MDTKVDVVKTTLDYLNLIDSYALSQITIDLIEEINIEVGADYEGILYELVDSYCYKIVNIVEVIDREKFSKDYLALGAIEELLRSLSQDLKKYE